MDKDSFGETLKRERELRGVTLEEISLATRISTRFLRAIEEERWGELPGGVFNRGFVRAMARYLGLDEENTVAEYLLAVEVRPTVPAAPPSRPPVITPEHPWLAWILATVVVISVIATGWVGVRRFMMWRAARQIPHPANVNSVPTPDLLLPSVPVPLAGRAATGVPNSRGPEPIELRIQAGKKTKVTVDSDSGRVFEGTLNAGENRTFSAKDHFDVSVNDAGALELEMNGKMLAPIGPAGRPAKVTLVRDTLKGSSGGRN